jgi:hypothetical protein
VKAVVLSAVYAVVLSAVIAPDGGCETPDATSRQMLMPIPSILNPWPDDMEQNRPDRETDNHS